MLRIIFTYLLASLVPLTFWILLRAELPLPFILGLVWIRLSCLLAWHKTKGRINRTMSFVSPLVSLLFAAFILAGVLITPFSAYSIWFEAVSDNAPKGVVSNLLVLLSAFLASSINLFSGDIVQSLLIMALLGTGLLAVIYQLPPTYLALLALLLVLVVYLALSRTERKNRWRSLAGALVLTLVVASVSFPLSKLAGIGGSAIVDRHLHPGLRRALVQILPRFPLLYGVPGFGYAFDEKKLGGTPVLSESPLFEVESVTGVKGIGPLYLRTQVFDLYDGKTWRSTTDQGEESTDRVELSTNFSFPHYLKIRLLLEYYHLLPHTLDTGRIGLGELRAVRETEQDPLVRGNRHSALSLSAPWRAGETIYLERIPAADPPPELDPEQEARYLQIPDSLTRRTRELAASLAARTASIASPAAPASLAADNPEQLLGAIEHFLAANFVYTLKVPFPKPGDDFVDQFLFSSLGGYCVHFASALVLLARLNGVPARYATGFLHYLPSRGGPSTVSGLSSHAWPEVWIKGKGWQVWEATAALNPVYYDELEDLWFYSYSRQYDRRTTRQLTAILGRRPTQGPIEQDPKNIHLRPTLFFLLLLAPLFLAVRLIIYLSPLIRHDRAAALTLLKRIIRAPALRALAPPVQSGWIAWNRDARDLLPQLQLPLGRLLSLCLALVYGQAPVRRRDIRFLFDLHRKLRRIPGRGAG